MQTKCIHAGFCDKGVSLELRVIVGFELVSHEQDLASTTRLMNIEQLQVLWLCSMHVIMNVQFSNEKYIIISDKRKLNTVFVVNNVCYIPVFVSVPKIIRCFKNEWSIKMFYMKHCTKEITLYMCFNLDRYGIAI